MLYLSLVMGMGCSCLSHIFEIINNSLEFCIDNSQSVLQNDLPKVYNYRYKCSTLW